AEFGLNKGLILWFKKFVDNLSFSVIMSVCFFRRMRMNLNIFDIKIVYLMNYQKEHKKKPANNKKKILRSKPVLTSSNNFSSKTSFKSHVLN
ncbi:hypothetical protein EGH73_08310, partial [Epilithonimonas hominis]